MEYNPNKIPAKIINEGAFRVLILETFIPVLMESGTKVIERIWSVEKNLSEVLLLKLMLLIMNMVLSVEHR